MTKHNDKKGTALTIDWKPDRNSKLPLYSQIVRYFSDKVSRGDFVSGQLLPSQRLMAELFQVNRSTIVEAMNELASLGLIECEFGAGTRIANGTWSFMTQGKTPNWKSYIEAGGFQSNIPTVQMINQMEFVDGFTRLGTGELSPDLLPTDLIRTALSNLSHKNLFINYPDPQGIPGLRAAVCQYLQRFGIDLPASCILIVSGAVQALQLISAGIVQPKSTLYIESPSYINSLNIFQSSGARLESIPVDNSGVLPWMMRASESKTRDSMLYVIPTFQNPTGIVMPISRRLEVLNYCKEHHMPIIEDDVFRDLWLGDPPPPPIKSMDDEGSVIYIGSLSKCFAPGLRIGWLAGPEAVVQRLADVKMQMDYGVSSLAQQITEELFVSGLYDEGMKQVRSRLRTRRDIMMNLLTRYFDDLADWKHPEGGFFVWLRFKNRLSADRLFDYALKERMLLTPGSMYDKKYTNCLRLSYGYLDPEQMERCMERLSQITRELLIQ